MSVAVKICGLTDRDSLHAAIEAGASYLGFVFVTASKRAITPQAAQGLLATLPHPTLCRFTKATGPIDESEALVLTALFVNPSDEMLDETIQALSPFLGLIQLHGQETPERVAQIRQNTGLPVMKALPIGSTQDLAAIALYEPVADMLLFDAKVDGKLTGGSGKRIDWTILKNAKISKPWMLAGGLTTKNIGKAVKESGASIIDLSSSVETDGRKDPAKIKTLLEQANEL